MSQYVNNPARWIASWVINPYQHLSHVGVNKGYSRSAFSPRLELIFVSFPRQGFPHDSLERKYESWVRIPLRLGPPERGYIYLQVKYWVAVAQTDKFEVISPNEFEENPVSALVGDSFRFVAPNLRVNLTGRKTSKRQPRTELGRVILTYNERRYWKG